MSTDSLHSSEFEFNEKEEKLQEMITIVRERILGKKFFEFIHQ